MKEKSIRIDTRNLDLDSYFKSLPEIDITNIEKQINSAVQIPLSHNGSGHVYHSIIFRIKEITPGFYEWVLSEVVDHGEDK